MVEPRYQELLKKDIPHVSKDGVHVAVIAGESMGASVSYTCPSPSSTETKAMQFPSPWPGSVETYIINILIVFCLANVLTDLHLQLLYCILGFIMKGFIYRDTALQLTPNSQAL